MSLGSCFIFVMVFFSRLIFLDFFINLFSVDGVIDAVTDDVNHVVDEFSFDIKGMEFALVVLLC